MRQKEPHLTFALAFNRLTKEKPELFNFDGLEERGQKQTAASILLHGSQKG